MGNVFPRGNFRFDRDGVSSCFIGHRVTEPKINKELQIIKTNKNVTPEVTPLVWFKTGIEMFVTHVTGVTHVTAIKGVIVAIELALVGSR